MEHVGGPRSCSSLLNTVLFSNTLPVIAFLAYRLCELENLILLSYLNKLIVCIQYFVCCMNVLKDGLSCCMHGGP